MGKRGAGERLSKKDEVIVGQGLSGWAPTIKRFFPRLFNRLTAKVNFK